MQQHAATFFEQAESAVGADLQQFVKDEFDAFLECGILAHGFLRPCCGDCGHDKLVAFNCKRRGFCPSCGARRMAETAAHLVDHVIPHLPVRQWVLSLPILLRLLLAAATRVMGGGAQFDNFALKAMPANALYASAFDGESPAPMVAK